MKKLVLSAVLLSGSGLLSWAAEQTFESGPSSVHLIELFTSEGCSSCPPAEERLSQLVSSPDLWSKIVPVSFHVDYWDNLGWPDTFASKTYTDRQYAYAHQWGNSSVYTPGFVVDGLEARSGLSTIGAMTDQRPGNLQIQIHDQTVLANFSAQQKFSSPLRLQVALLGCGIQSNVQRGENGGRNLHHDFVVLALQTMPLTLSSDGTRYIASTPLPQRHINCRPALVAWVEDPDVLRPIQSVGGWMAPQQ